LSEEALREQRERFSWQLSVAGAIAGISAGGFLVAVLTHVSRTWGWHVRVYEPAAALLGALGVWGFSPRRGSKEGLIGMGAALLAMLLGDVFRTMAFTALEDWGEVPQLLLRRFGWRRSPQAWFSWRYWPKLLRYAFGLYIGWYLCSAGRAGAPEPAAASEEPAAGSSKETEQEEGADEST